MDPVPNLNTSTYLRKTVETSDLSINTPYITKNFASLASKQLSLKSNSMIF